MTNDELRDKLARGERERALLPYVSEVAEYRRKLAMAERMVALWLQKESEYRAANFGHGTIRFAKERLKLYQSDVKWFRSCLDKAERTLKRMQLLQ